MKQYVMLKWFFDIFDKVDNFKINWNGLNIYYLIFFNCMRKIIKYVKKIFEAFFE